MPCTATQTRIEMSEPTTMGTNMTDMDLARQALDLCELVGDVQLKARQDGTIEVVTRQNAQERKKRLCKKYSELKVMKEARKRGYVVTKSTGTNNETKIHVVVGGR